MTMKRSGGHPTAERAAEIKASVVAATMKVFAEKGSAFNMDEVAQLADVSKQAIYRRWRSKIDLVIDVIEVSLSEGLDRPIRPDDDPVSALEALAWQHFGQDQVASNRISVYLQIQSFRDEVLHSRMMAWRGRYIETYRQALLRIDAADRRVSGDIEVQSELLMDLLCSGIHKLAHLRLTKSEDQRRCFDERWDAFRRIAIR